MCEHFGWLTLGRVSNALKIMVLVTLVATIANRVSAQTQTSTDTNTREAITAMVESAKTSPAGTSKTTEAPVAARNTALPVPQGAGSNNPAYVFFRGYLFKVHRSNGDPAVIEHSGSVTTAVKNFNYGTEGAFKIEGGFNFSANFGVRGSFFYTNQRAEEDRTGASTAPFFVSPRPLNVTFTGNATAGTPATFKERFRLFVIDLEPTYKWHGNNYSVVVSGGLRIAAHRQEYKAHDVFATTIIEDVPYNQHRTGYGPTGAIDGRRRIGGSNFWFTGAARVALIFGRISEDANYITTTSNSPTFRTSSRHTPVLEGEGGVEWSHAVGSGNEFFINGSFIVHSWRDLINVVPTNAAGGSPTATLDNPLSPPSKKGSVTFVGGSFSVGFRF